MGCQSIQLFCDPVNRLSVQEVLSLCADYGIASSEKGLCSMGVDQGRDLHVIIGKMHPAKAAEIVHIGIYKDWEDLDRLMTQFNVSRCVVDAMPEIRNARAFAERFKGRVYMNYYSIHQKGSYVWNEGKLVVTCNRTESLDASHREIMDQEGFQCGTDYIYELAKWVKVPRLLQCRYMETIPTIR